MSWKVIYHYADDEEQGATWSFDGTAKAYDRADRIELVSPEGEVIGTHYVTDDAAKEAGTRAEVKTAEAQASGSNPAAPEIHRAGK